VLGLVVAVNIVFMVAIFFFIENAHNIVDKSHDIVKAIILGVTFSFFLFVIVSGLFFAANQFSYRWSLLTCLVVSGVVLLVALYTRRKGIKNLVWTVQLPKNDYLILGLFIIAGIILTMNKFDFFGMGQDQGVYQTKAIELMYGHYGNVINFPEYNMLTNANDKTMFSDALHTLPGLYQYDFFPVPAWFRFVPLDATTAWYHGIPTFPALLALSGKLFGLANMMQIQSVFYILGICFVWLICGNLKLKLSAKIFSTFVFTISPIILWVSKSALTEIFTVVIILAFIYFLTSLEYRVSQILLCVPVIVFSFYHISVYTMMPLFFIIFAYLLIRRRSKYIFFSAIASMLGYGVGFAIMVLSGPHYTIMNYSPIYVISFVNENTLPYVVVSGVGIAIALLTLIYIKKPSYLWLFRIFSKAIIFRCIIAVMLALCIYVGFKLSFSTLPVQNPLQSYYYGLGFSAFKQVTLIAFTFGVGVVTMCMALYSLLKYPYIFINNAKYALVCLMFFYCILFYAVMRPEVYYYYYYSRYLAPFIAIIILIAGIGLSQYKGGEKKYRYIVCILYVLTCFIVFPNIKILVTDKDESLLQWNILEDFAKEIKPNDVVLIDAAPEGNCLNRFYLPLRAMTGASVFPNLDYKNDSFLNTSGNIYIITADDNKYMATGKYEIQLKYSNMISRGITTMSETRANYTPFPVYFPKSEEKISLLESLDKHSYNFADNDFSTGGFSGPYNGFRWAIDGHSYVSMYFTKDDYQLTVTQGALIPFDELKNRPISVVFSINGHDLKTVSNAELKNQSFSLTIPKAYIQNGYNKLEMAFNTWSPVEYGKGDTRNLGISVSKIEVKSVDQAKKGQLTD